jgi:hypothetical protein
VDRLAQMTAIDSSLQIENVSFTFSDPKLERLVSLTPADRRWMDDVVKTVEETWEVVSTEIASRSCADSRMMVREQRKLCLSRGPVKAHARFRGSDDDLRQRFEEYLCAALASIKYTDFVAKGQAQEMTIVGLCELGLL